MASQFLSMESSHPTGRGNHRGRTSGKLPSPSEAPKLFCFCSILFYYITIILIMISIIGIIAKENLLFRLEFIAEIGGAALLGGISATIGHGGNLCKTVTVAAY